MFAKNKQRQKTNHSAHLSNYKQYTTMEGTEKQTVEFDENMKSNLFSTAKWMNFTAVFLCGFNFGLIVINILQDKPIRHLYQVLILLIPAFVMFCTAKSIKKWLNSGEQNDLRKLVQDNLLLWKCIGLSALIPTAIGIVTLLIIKLIG